MKATVLFSGGIDSAACVHFLKERGHDVAGVFVDFGQAAARLERQSAELMRGNLSVPLRIVQASSHEVFGIGELTGRNAFLIFSAMLLGGCRDGLLAMRLNMRKFTADENFEVFGKHHARIKAAYGSMTAELPGD